MEVSCPAFLRSFPATYRSRFVPRSLRISKMKFPVHPRACDLLSLLLFDPRHYLSLSFLSLKFPISLNKNKVSMRKTILH